MPDTSSCFSNIPAFPRDEAFGCTLDYANDTDPRKVNLGAGVYRDENGQPWVLPSVRKAEQILMSDPNIDHEYLPIIGHSGFISSAQSLVFGPNHSSLLSRTASIQTISGTGANHTAATFLATTLKPAHVWLPSPTWPNHHIIWDLISPGIPQRSYPYYNPQTQTLDIESMVQELDLYAQRGDIILLHACAHNPTGLDPSPADWTTILDVCRRREIFPLFDAAYLGFATGNPATDAAAIRLFASSTTSSSSICGSREGHAPLEFGVAQSFSKNFGLYSERVGAFHLVTSTPAAKEKALGMLSHIQRGEISNPPAFGARVVSLILGDEGLKRQWEEDLRTMSGRIRRMREGLFRELVRQKTPGEWRHVIEQVGMFSYTGLSSSMVERLRTEFHIYMLRSGRASISGLNDSNVKYVAKAIDTVVRERLALEAEEAKAAAAAAELACQTKEQAQAKTEAAAASIDEDEQEDGDEAEDWIYADLAMIVAQHASRQAWFDMPDVQPAVGYVQPLDSLMGRSADVVAIRA